MPWKKLKHKTPEVILTAIMDDAELAGDSNMASSVLSKVGLYCYNSLYIGDLNPCALK